MKYSRNIDENMVKEMVEMFNNNISAKRIGEKFNYTPEGVRKILKKQGINTGINSEQGKLQASKDEIFELYKNGMNITDIARKYNCARTSIVKIFDKLKIQFPENIEEINKNISLINEIKKSEESDITNYNKNFRQNLQNDPRVTDEKFWATTYIPTYNGIQLTKANLQNYSNEEKNEIANFLFKFYRDRGFPYPELSNEEILNDFSLLRYCNIQNKDKKIPISNYSGNEIVKYFCTNIFSGKLRNKDSLLEAFNNDLKLMNCIKNRIGLTYNETFTICGNMIRQGLRNSNQGMPISSFRPSVAKFIYEKFVPKDGVIYDYSFGYGHRLLGAMASKNNYTYIGTDPNTETFKNVNKIKEFLINNKLTSKEKIHLFNCGSENFINEEFKNSVDFIFSSPPYHMIEKYCDEPTQVYNLSYFDFINNWWDKTVKNIKNIMKPSGIFSLNMIEKINQKTILKDMLNICENNGFEIIDTYYLELSKNNNFRNNLEKLEPIIFMRLNTDINNSKINITECNKENIETADETKKSEIIKSEYSKEIEEKCCELFKSGTSLRQITKDLNLPKRKVKEFIDNNNIKIPTNKDRYNEEFLNTLIKEYDEGLSIEKLSKKYSCSSNIINKKFKELGVEQRSIYDRNRKYKINHNVFDNIDSEIKAYYLGLFVTDGSMSSKGADISIRLIYSDLEILQRLSYLFYDCDRAFIYDAKDGSNPTAKLYVSSTPIKQKLIELGITPNKTFTTHYLPCITEEYHRHFIRGLIDGDGYLGLRKEMNGAAIILTGTQALLSRVGEILKQKLNIKFRLKKDTNKNTFSLNITHYGDVKTVCNWLYEGSTIYLKRKFNNYQEICIKYYELYGTKYSKEQFKDIKQMYVNNVDIKTISSKMNISEAIVIRILKRERVIDDTELEVTQSDDT